jgi:hypothetical protein
LAVVGVGQDGVDAGVVVVAAVQVERGCAAEVARVGVWSSWSVMVVVPSCGRC